MTYDKQRRLLAERNGPGIDAVRDRWADAEGTLTLRISGGDDDDTDLEYRGALGKWTLARIFGDGTYEREDWAQRFAHAADDVRALLTECDTLHALATKIADERDAAVRENGELRERYALIAAACDSAIIALEQIEFHDGYDGNGERVRVMDVIKDLRLGAFCRSATERAP